MKYAEGLDPSKTIRNYEKVGNRIIINYLDGSNRVIPLLEENEKKVIENMIKQAEEYINNMDSKKVIKDGNGDLVISLLSGAMAAISTVGLVSGEVPKNCDTMVGFFAVFNGLTSVCFGLGLLGKTESEEERKKYKEYLKIMNKIKDNDINSQLYKDVESEAKLTINTLDNYSLKDIKIIKRNLKKCK